MDLPILLLNSAVMTADGQYNVYTITPPKAQDLIHISRGHYSAVGIEPAATALEEILKIPVPVNRERVSQQVRQLAIVLRLADRTVEPDVIRENGVDYLLQLIIRTR